MSVFVVAPEHPLTVLRFSPFDWSLQLVSVILLAVVPFAFMFAPFCMYRLFPGPYFIVVPAGMFSVFPVPSMYVSVLM